MDASLVLNADNELALLYTEDLDFVPEWACVDVELGEMYVGGPDTENMTIKMDEADTRIYAKVYTEPKILLVQVEDNLRKNPLRAIRVPLMVARQFQR